MGKDTESLVSEIFEIWNFDSEMDLDSDAGLTERKSDLTEKRSSEISDEMNETLNPLKPQNSRAFRQKLENFHYPSTARIWYCGPQDLKILHLSLYRGEYWQDFLTNFHYFSKNGEKMLAFECNLEYYLVGDNFFVSKDSRHWGTIPKDKIYGKVQQMER